MNNKILTAERVCKAYRAKESTEASEVLKGLDLSIDKGEFTAIMGPSGVGKSTLLYLLGSLDFPDSGIIKLFDDDQVFEFSEMNGEKLSAIRNKKIGFVFQFHHLLPEFNTIENVMMPALIAGESFNRAKEKALGLIKTVGIEDRIKHKPSELSGGEQQRAAIARALINDPVLVLADEPTGNLDKKNSDSVMELISGLKEEYKITFLVATHSKIVADIAGRILLMGNGIIENDIKK